MGSLLHAAGQLDNRGKTSIANTPQLGIFTNTNTYPSTDTYTVKKTIQILIRRQAWPTHMSFAYFLSVFFYFKLALP